MLGRRILIYGATGSGKTTLSRHLGGALRLPVIELDAIRHDGGWDATPWDEMLRRVQASLDASPGGWVCEGGYDVVQPLLLPYADTVVWLHLPWRVSFRRLLARSLHHCRTGAPFFHENGPVETWRQSFFSRRSILLWSITHHSHSVRAVRQRIASAPHASVIELRSAREVGKLINEIEAGSALCKATGALD